MAITFDQALTLGTFHCVGVREDGASRCYVWRRNGMTKTWVTRPGHYRIPVKYGLWDYGAILSAGQTAPGLPSGNGVYAPNECPVCGGTKR